MKYRDIIESALHNHGADYCEIRIEETDNTRLTYRGNSLDTIGQTSGLGGNVRAVTRGGWGFASFNSIDELKSKVFDATAQSKAVGDSKTELSHVDPCVDVVPAYIVNDPFRVPLAEKKRIMDHYKDLIWSVKGINSADIIYADTSRKTFFGSSDGSYIEQEQVHVISRISAQARDGGDVQQAGFSLGSQGDFNLIRDLDDQVIAAAKRAVSLLDAKSLEGGERTVILDPVLAGVFVHEAFGHLSEGDNVYENEKLKDIMYMGRKFGGKHLNFTDGAAIPGLRGSFKYDDEGTLSTRTPVVREGELVGRLHSRQTAAKLGEQPTGNARAIGYNFPPIVRMTNTIIEQGEATFDDLIEGVADGVYVRNWYGGMTQHEMFTFSSGEAYMIRNGEIQEAVRPVMLTGNLFQTLNNLDGVGNDLGMNQGGGCGKGGQSRLPVSNGSPHIRIQKCLISGA